MPLANFNFEDIVTFTRPAPADYTDVNGDPQTAGINIPRFNYESAGVFDGFLVDKSLSEDATVSTDSWYNPDEGTWIVDGRFVQPNMLNANYVVDGAGKFVYTYNPTGARIFGSGMKIEDISLPSVPATIKLNTAGLAAYKKVQYFPRAFTDVEAEAESSGDVVMGVLNLFKAGEQGFWYDHNDLSTLFQDSAGTIPVTAAGQPVGLKLDKSKGLTIGPELVPNGHFTVDASGWTGMGGTLSTAAGELVLTSTGAGFAARAQLAAITTVPGVVYGGSVRTSTGGAVRVGTTAGGADVYPNTLIGLGASHSFTFIATTTTTHLSLVGSSALGVANRFDDVTMHALPANHAAQPTAGSRPILRLNATTGYHYLECDGVDDWMVTASINFTSTDKVSLFAGVRKLSDGTRGILLELSAVLNLNAFVLGAPNVGGSANYGTTSRGGSTTTNLSASATNAIYAAPHSAVIAVKHDLGADSCSISVNGVLAASGTVDVTGNFGNYPLYLYRRAGTSLPFNGHSYGEICTGRLTTAAEIAAIEQYFALRTGVTLP